MDIEEELKMFDWDEATWTDEKLIACSPFRDDARPSFYCWLKDSPRASAGFWQDSGGSGEHEKGGFISLLSFLRNETIDDTVDYLWDKYGTGIGRISLRQIRMKQKKKQKPLPPSLTQNLSPHEYLIDRGIPKGIQKALNVGYNVDKKAIAIPWLLPNGDLGNIKYRRIDNKFFWYEKGGVSIGKMLWGINILHEKDYLDTVYICEAEIDAMYIMTAGYPCVAVGGSKFNKEKRDLLIRTNVKRVVIVPDNDEAGENLKNQIVKHLVGTKEVHVCRLPSKYKDANDVPYGELKEILNKTYRVPLFNFKL